VEQLGLVLVSRKVVHRIQLLKEEDLNLQPRIATWQAKNSKV
jgi:hypothetical protein